MTRDLSPFRVNTHELPRRAGEMKEYSIDFDLTEAFGVELISVPPGEIIEVDLRLESVTEGILATADVFATTCQTAAKIAWITDLDTSYTVTDDSTFAMSVKATDANSLQFSEGGDNDIIKIMSGAPKIFLSVTD